MQESTRAGLKSFGQVSGCAWLGWCFWMPIWISDLPWPSSKTTSAPTKVPPIRSSSVPRPLASVVSPLGSRAWKVASTSSPVTTAGAEDFTVVGVVAGPAPAAVVVGAAAALTVPASFAPAEPVRYTAPVPTRASAAAPPTTAAVERRRQWLRPRR